MPCGHSCACPTYRDHLLTVGISPTAMPERKQRERAFTKDADSYRRLRKDGLQPKTSGGAHRLEQQAEHAIEVETGVLLSDVPR